jgi:hypothetical protein
MESPAKEEAGGELAMEIESTVTAEDWRRALALVVPSVVVLRTTAPRAFDTEVAGASYATGFVVDKSRGIILTNRHVVKPGPVVAEAMFVNREEIPVYPLYRDPVSVCFHFISFHFCSILFCSPCANGIMLIQNFSPSSRNRYMILVFFAMIQVLSSSLSMMRSR